MDKNIIVSKVDSIPVNEREVELVERKGHGHPDYMADSIAEAVSRELSRYYREEFGDVLHHNVDKVLVVGGQVSRGFGGGVMIQPIYILVAGRATVEVEREDGTKVRVPIGPIILRAARDWLRNTFREEYFNIDEHVIIDYRIGQGSADLRRLVEKRVRYPPANDTSVGVGFAPLSETERIVREVEEELYRRRTKIPAIGEDIKVMGLRVKDDIRLTVATAIMAQEVSCVEEYREVKEKIKEIALGVAKKYTERNVEVLVNTADNYEAGAGGVYLVITGTSAEHGDDGATGRGNRINGLITPFRPMSLEAAAGKNPVSHVGKIYNIVAQRAADKIAQLPGVVEVYVELLSKIGYPINDPQIASVNMIVEDDERFGAIRKEAEAIVAEELDRIDELKYEFISDSPPPVC